MPQKGAPWKGARRTLTSHANPSTPAIPIGPRPEREFPNSPNLPSTPGAPINPRSPQPHPPSKKGHTARDRNTAEKSSSGGFSLRLSNLCGVPFWVGLDWGWRRTPSTPGAPLNPRSPQPHPPSKKDTPQEMGTPQRRVFQKGFLCGFPTSAVSHSGSVWVGGGGGLPARPERPSVPVRDTFPHMP